MEKFTKDNPEQALILHFEDMKVVCYVYQVKVRVMNAMENPSLSEEKKLEFMEEYIIFLILVKKKKTPQKPRLWVRDRTA